MAVDKMAINARGTLAKIGATVIRFTQAACIVTVLVLGVVSAMSTSTALPKFPAGMRACATSFPTLLSTPSAAPQAG